MKQVAATITVVSIVVVSVCAAWWNWNPGESGDRVKLVHTTDDSGVGNRSLDVHADRATQNATASGATTLGPQVQEPKPIEPAAPYAPIIQSILDSQDGKRALYAVQKLDWCDSIDSVARIAFDRKDTVKEARLRAGYAQAAAHFQDEQRACQGVTPQLKANRTQLLKLAVLENTPGAGYKYLATGKEGENNDPETWRIALSNAISDARSGHLLSIQLLALEGGNYKLSKEDQWIYSLAAGKIQRGEQSVGSEMADDLIRQGFSINAPPSDTPSEVVKRVETEAQRIVDLYRSQQSSHP